MVDQCLSIVLLEGFGNSHTMTWIKGVIFKLFLLSMDHMEKRKVEEPI